MLTGTVSIHAITMCMMVSFWIFLIPHVATMLPAIADDKTCVVLTGIPSRVLTPIVLAAANSETAHCT